MSFTVNSQNSVVNNYQLSEAALADDKPAITAERAKASDASGAVVSPQMPVDQFNITAGSASSISTPAQSGGVTGAFQVNGSKVVVPAGSLAKELDKLVKLDDLLTAKSYNNAIASKAYRNSFSFYTQVHNQLGELQQKAASSIALLKGQNPVDEVQLEQFTHLANFAGKLDTLYANLATARQASDSGREAAATQLMTDITACRQELALMDPAMIGEAQYHTLSDAMNDFAQIAMVYSSMDFSGVTTASGQLGVFFLQTHERLRSIEGKSGTFRRRGNETPDITGALNTYGNDVKDMAVFNQRFAQIRSAVLKDGIIDAHAIEERLMAAVPGTSSAFKEAVKNFAVVYSQMGQADGAYNQAKEHLAYAEEACHNAAGRLLEASQAMDNSDDLRTLSLQNLSQNNLTAAKKMADQAHKLQEKADKYLAQYDNLKKQGLGESMEALHYKEAASACLALAASYNQLVKSGPYARSLEPETRAIDGQIGQRYSNLAIIDNNVNELLSRFEVMDSFAMNMVNLNKELGKSLLSLDAGLSVSEMAEKTKELASAGVASGSERIVDGIYNYLDRCNIKHSYELTMFLRDPAAMAQKDPALAEKATAELQSLMEDHPQLAELVGGGFLELENDFKATRKQAEEAIRKAGHDPNSEQYQDYLNTLEASLVDGILSKNLVLFQCAITAGGLKNGRVDKMMKWVYDNRHVNADMLVKDPQKSEQAVANFNKWLKSNSELQAKYDEKVKQYGQPVRQCCVSLMLNSSGSIRPITVSIFIDGDKYKAYNPVDGKIYSGKSPDAALEAMADECNLANGRLSYKDSRGKLVAKEIKAPSDSTAMDVGMAITGAVGSLLILLPEPATTVIGTGMVAVSATYSVYQGTKVLVDQLEHETFDMSSDESRDAVWNVVSGLACGAASTTKVLQTAKLVSSGSKVAKGIISTKNAIDIYGDLSKLNDNLNTLYTSEFNLQTWDTWKTLGKTSANLILLGYHGSKFYKAPAKLMTTSGKVDPVKAAEKGYKFVTVINKTNSIVDNVNQLSIKVDDEEIAQLTLEAMDSPGQFPE